MSSLKYLLKREWSMGNGQCPDCYGVPESWHGHPLHKEANTIGHTDKCALAAAIADAGGKPLYIGDFKTEVEWESCLVPMGGMLIHSTQIKGSNPEHRALMIKANEEAGKRMDKAIWDALFNRGSEIDASGGADGG